MNTTLSEFHFDNKEIDFSKFLQREKLNPIPFLIRLRDCKQGRLPSPAELPLLIANEVGTPPVNWVKDVLEEGRSIILLDGVDEVPNHQRDDIRKSIQAIASKYPLNWLVVTTRPSAVPDGWLAALDFNEASLNPMSAQDRAEFISRWHKAVSEELARQGKIIDLTELADELTQKLIETPAIARLSTNPLLCAALCALHRDRHRKLPESQSELCEALCQLLLHRREAQGGLSLSEFPEEYRDLTYEQKRSIVQEVAHHMVRNEDSTIDEGDAKSAAEKILRNFPSGKQGDAQVVMKALVERSGVLREQKRGLIDFIHNTIKEFLSAEIFVEKKDLSTLARRATDDEWRQVVLFASATRDKGFATRLVKKILEIAEANPEKERQYKLAALSCRYAALHMSPDLVEKLSTIEQSLVPPRNMQDAESLALSGDNVVHLLKYKRMRARDAAACVRTLRLIGTEASTQMLDGYLEDMRKIVVAELAQAVNPLKLKSVRENVAEGGFVTESVRRQINDITPLSEMKDVRELYLADCPITDFTPLKTLANLKELTISSTKISKFGDLPALSSLTDLNVSFTKISSFDGIEQLVNLENLSVHFCPIESAQGLMKNSKIRRLGISCTKISDLSPLSDVRGLRDLNISSAENLNWDTLPAVSQLQQIFISRGKNIQLDKIPTGIRVIGAVESDVKNLDALINHPELRTLWLDSSHVSDISPLAHSKNLTELSLSRLIIEDFKPLSHMSELTQLELDGTNILDVSPLAHCEKLSFLSISGTKVLDLSSIGHLPLTRISFNLTKEFDVTSLSRIISLEEIWVDELNEDLADVLLGLSRLREIVANAADTDALKKLRKRSDLIVHAGRRIKH